MHHAGRRPLQVRTMTLRAMLVDGDGTPTSAAAKMGRDTDATLGDLYGIFNLRFIPRFSWPRRHDAETAMQGKVVISWVQIRIVAMRLGNASLGVIGDRNRWNAAEVFERMHVSAQPRLHLLI